MLAAFDRQLGAMRLELTAAPSPRLVAAVRKGQLDTALLALPSATFELAVQPLAKKRKLSLSDIAAEPIYWFERH